MWKFYVIHWVKGKCDEDENLPQYWPISFKIRCSHFFYRINEIICPFIVYRPLTAWTIYISVSTYRLCRDFGKILLWQLGEIINIFCMVFELVSFKNVPWFFIRQNINLENSFYFLIIVASRRHVETDRIFLRSFCSWFHWLFACLHMCVRECVCLLVVTPKPSVVFICYGSSSRGSSWVYCKKEKKNRMP